MEPAISKENRNSLRFTLHQIFVKTIVYYNFAKIRLRCYWTNACELWCYKSNTVIISVLVFNAIKIKNLECN